MLAWKSFDTWIANKQFQNVIHQERSTVAGLVETWCSNSGEYRSLTTQLDRWMENG